MAQCQGYSIFYGTIDQCERAALLDVSGGGLSEGQAYRLQLSRFELYSALEAYSTNGTVLYRAVVSRTGSAYGMCSRCRGNLPDSPCSDFFLRALHLPFEHYLYCNTRAKHDTNYDMS